MVVFRSLYFGGKRTGPKHSTRGCFCRAHSARSQTGRENQIVGVICVALAGRGYHETYLQYLITISAGFAIGNIVFLLMYGFASCRPGEGRSATKLIETIYQLTASILYLAAVGATTVQVDYLKPFMGPVTVFTTFNFGIYTFGGLVALTELVCEDPTKPPAVANPITVDAAKTSGL
ncbi:unnamed protein product [Echinostoma caproni]|uniref:MARVEL domain-containing protein n=1 Tax=Echinostoma caproni TaxID=27848 RepID=A0A183A6T2_9TREM|nr:unnamed protein product [Echinostoma caproni]